MTLCHNQSMVLKPFDIIYGWNVFSSKSSDNQTFPAVLVKPNFLACFCLSAEKCFFSSIVFSKNGKISFKKFFKPSATRMSALTVVKKFSPEIAFREFATIIFCGILLKFCTECLPLKWRVIHWFHKLSHRSLTR